MSHPFHGAGDCIRYRCGRHLEARSRLGVADGGKNRMRFLKTVSLLSQFARRHPEAPGPARQAWWTRGFWPAWFDIDDVHPSPDHMPYLQSKFETCWFDEGRSRVPGMPWLRPPYYCFVGRKRGE